MTCKLKFEMDGHSLLVYVFILTCKSRWTIAGVSGNRILTNASIFARVRNAIIYVNLTSWSGESNGARTLKWVDEVTAYSSIQAGIILAFVNIYFALCSRKTCNNWTDYCNYHNHRRRISIYYCSLRVGWLLVTVLVWVWIYYTASSIDKKNE